MMKADQQKKNTTSRNQSQNADLVGSIDYMHINETDLATISKGETKLPFQVNA